MAPAGPLRPFGEGPAARGVAGGGFLARDEELVRCTSLRCGALRGVGVFAWRPSMRLLISHSALAKRICPPLLPTQRYPGTVEASNSRNETFRVSYDDWLEETITLRKARKRTSSTCAGSSGVLASRQPSSPCGTASRRGEWALTWFCAVATSFVPGARSARGVSSWRGGGRRRRAPPLAEAAPAGVNRRVTRRRMRRLRRCGSGASMTTISGGSVREA